MMPKIKLLLFLILPTTILSQNITGKIYDNESTVKGAKIFNLSKNTSTYTDDKGDFKILASVNDTLVFSSLFHNEKKIKLIGNHFKETNVFELKKTVNNLDEVLLSENREVVIFNDEIYAEILGLQIKNDMKNNPYKYQPPPSGNLDFIKIAGLIGKLFKNKKKKDVPIITTTYKAFDSLFKNDTFFNKELLTNQLQIKEAYKPLFFNYCDTKQLDKKLLKKENRVILLDSLFNYSKEFLEIVKKSEKDSITN
ncbi:carboxypeptidase-like regulatory domain-containing protein [Thalassobellus citreus]|uniref:carboxypeptidase-like regulatory domain-containing protein n=1 Tax=Thalassobellus citreus TaxID=3367752 RepID=UPI0037B5C35F